jgi:hypothetical protein
VSKESERLRSLIMSTANAAARTRALTPEDFPEVEEDYRAEVARATNECRELWERGDVRGFHAVVGQSVADLIDKVRWTESEGLTDPRELAKQARGERSAAEEPDDPRKLAESITNVWS